MSIGDITNTLLLGVTSLGVWAAFLQVKSGARSQRSVFLKDLYMQFRTDGEIAAAFYLIEYDGFHYDSSFHGSDMEPKIDRLLSLIDLVCELHAQDILSKREMDFFYYRFKRVAENKGICDYICFLGNFYKINGFDREPYAAFQKFVRIEMHFLPSANS